MNRKRPARRADWQPGIEGLERRLAPAVGIVPGARLPAFDIGLPNVADIWVDPVRGTDGAAGATRGQAVRTLTEAWRRVPMDVPLARGFRINLVAGVYPEEIVPNYWENRLGSFSAPVILRAADGPGTAKLPGMNVAGCTSLYLDGLDISAGGGDVLHFAACSRILVRNCTVRGTGSIADYAVPQETLKVNQCQYVYVEGCDISGAWDNAIDFVAVQYGHVVGSRVHRSGDWAMYAKGGSAALTITGNEFFDAGTGGFTAGQGTGFEFMVAPWTRFEAYDISFTNNVVHDTQGAGFGVNGGRNIVIANNTLYRVGARSHVIEVGFGSRSCDGDVQTCRANLAAGGWGPTAPDVDVPIPNDGVQIVDNVVLNPDGYRSQWQHFAIAGPRQPPAGTNVPAPARADVNLRITGNVIWNGGPTQELGVENTALAAAIRGANAINGIRPTLVDPARGDYRLVTQPATPVPPPAPRPPLSATFGAVAAPVAGRPVTSVTITFSRPVRGVTLDDFVLTRGGAVVSLDGARITSRDGRSFTIANIPRTAAPGAYQLRLKLAGTGIVDAAGTGLAAAVRTAWTMPARAAAAFPRAGFIRG
jgi:hypothetical protein